VKITIKRDNFLPHQLQWWDLPNFYKLFLGGYGSGKTHIGALRSIYLSYINRPLAGMYVSPTWSLATKTIVETLRAMLGRSGIDYTYNQQRAEFTIHNWGGRIMLGSGDKPSSLIGVNCAWCGIDEPFIQKKEVFDQMTARVRHPDAKHREIFLTGTPEEINHWGYEMTNNTDIDLGVVVGSTLDNKYLPEQYKRNLLSAYSDAQIDAYVHGKFVNLTQGRVYSEFNRQDHVVPRPDLRNAGLPIELAQDYNVDYASCLAYFRGADFIHVFKEYREMNTNTYQMAELIKKDFPNVTVISDASGSARKSSAVKSDHAIMNDSGFDLKAPRRNPAVRDRVNSVQKLIRDGNFSCENTPNLVMDLEMNVWRLGDIDKRDPKQTHLSDALGYACNYYFPSVVKKAYSVKW